MTDTVRITEDGPFFGRIATVKHMHPVPGSSQVWPDVGGTKVVVAAHEIGQHKPREKTTWNGYSLP